MPEAPVTLPSAGMPEPPAPPALGKLSPRKLRRAVRRRWFERRIAALPMDDSVDMVHLGTPYGGWFIPDGAVDSSWTCWCVGAGQDISFDLALIERYGVRVRCFDPLPEYGAFARHEARDAPGFTFHEVAITPADGPLTMYSVSEHSGGALSGFDIVGGSRAYEVEGRSLASLQHELGDPRVDLLKIDLEGLEYEVLPSVDYAALGVRVLCTELHSVGSVADARRLVAQLERDHGFALVHRKHPTSLTFVRL